MEATTPIKCLQKEALLCEKDLNSREFAEHMDANDKLKRFRSLFAIPSCGAILKENQRYPDDLVKSNDCIYLSGNSLGLMPNSVKSRVDSQIETWSSKALYGHFEGDLPWANCETYVQEDMAKLVGAKTDEVLVTNSLTVNLNLLFVGFYKPHGKRRKILFEARAFPSDRFAFESQARLHSLDPKDCLIALEPREGEECLRTEDILRVIHDQGEEIAVICFPGVQYYTGQLFDIATITREGHQAGCIVGWDLAHAVGNVELSLHDWGVDFACWCTYKYLNCGAGCIASLFVHESVDVNSMTKLEGWWTNDLSTRFDMTTNMCRRKGSSSFAISNPPILLIASVRGSLDVFMEAGGMKPLREKSFLLTAYLEHLINVNLSNNNSKVRCTIITPNNYKERGCQLSLKFNHSVDDIAAILRQHGVVVDERKPNVIRASPVPLYNSFIDVYNFVQILRRVIDAQTY